MKRRKKRPNSEPSYGHRLLVTRLALGITEAEAAAAHDVTLKTYLRYESGSKPRDAEGMIKFAEKFGVDLDWIGIGYPHNLRANLTKNARGKLAILPVITSRYRELLAFWKQESKGT